jgi:hypothetical protein
MILIILCSPVVISFGGCAGAPEGPALEGVSGTVTLDGQPLKQGSISFSSGGASGGSVIADGEFAIARAEGLPAGKYRVVIDAGDEVPVARAPGPPGVSAARPKSERKRLVPKQYNEESTLTAEVKPGSPNVFEFALKK